MSTPFFAFLPGVAASVSATSSQLSRMRFCLGVLFKILSYHLNWVSFLSSGFATFLICFPSHVSRVALLPEVALACAPVPMCSKIWEVCFDVNTILDDSPINSGGATCSHHCSLLGGATSTRHEDAISGKRLIVPFDSDFLCVSLIRDGLASQHARSPTVLNAVSLVRSSAARGVF